MLLRESAFGARNACYLAEQAVEKGLKAVLVSRGIAFPLRTIFLLLSN